MKKILTIVVLCMCAAVVFAGPQHGHGHGRGGHRGCFRGNDGVWLAAGITNIVANGIQILNGIAYPRATVVTPVAPAPVYQQPVVVPQPVYQQRVVIPPQPMVVPQHVYQQQFVAPTQFVVVPQPAPAVYYRNVYIEKGYTPVMY